MTKTSADTHPSETWRNVDRKEERPVLRSIGRGLLMRCPNCGKGHLFSGFLRSVDQCASCGEVMEHHRADDLPPYLTIFIVGHLVVALFVGVERSYELSLLAHFLIWLPLTIALSLVLMQPLKGATIGLQWAMRMHGFGSGPADADH